MLIIRKKIGVWIFITKELCWVRFVEKDIMKYQTVGILNFNSIALLGHPLAAIRYKIRLNSVKIKGFIISILEQ